LPTRAALRQRGDDERCLDRAAELTGRKILLAGSHDRCWSGCRKRASGWTGCCLEAWFDEIVQGPSRLELGGTTVLLGHFPHRRDSHDRDRFGDHRPADRGAWLLYGHVHQRWARRGRMINVGVDATGFRLISKGEISRVIQTGPDNRAPSTSSPLPRRLNGSLM